MVQPIPGIPLPDFDEGMSEDAAYDLLSAFDAYSKNWMLVQFLSDGTITVDDIQRACNEGVGV